jgi:hypothetical protein
MSWYSLWPVNKQSIMSQCNVVTSSRSQFKVFYCAATPRRRRIMALMGVIVNKAISTPMQCITFLNISKLYASSHLSNHCHQCFKMTPWIMTLEDWFFVPLKPLCEESRSLHNQIEFYMDDYWFLHGWLLVARYHFQCQFMPIHHCGCVECGVLLFVQLARFI